MTGFSEGFYKKVKKERITLKQLNTKYWIYIF